MLTTMRRYTNTWVVRGMFILLVAAFSLWGIADQVRQMATTTAVATVAGQNIELPALQEAYQRQLAQVARMFGPGFSPTPEIRRGLADQALQRLIAQAAIRAEVKRMGIVVTDDAIRDATFAIRLFTGTDGRFSHQVMLQVLQSNGLDEPRFISMIRDDLAQRELIEAVRAGTVAPDTLVEAEFAYQGEKRVADLVEFPFAAVPPPPAPTEAQLQRYWDNNPDTFSTPEYRRIKAVILSVETLARDVDVTDQELQAAYEQRRATFNVPERRTARLLVAPDRARAEDLAQQWRSGADWAQMQAAATAAGASAIELPLASAAEFPDAALADAVFKAPANTVSDPLDTPLGWRVFEVTRITPAVARSFADVREELRTEIAEQKAGDQLYDRANKVEDALAGGGGLDQLPQGLGVAAVTGTLDAQGTTPAGRPAPIPGSPALRSALIAAAFQMKIGDPPRLTEVPASGAEAPSAYYAVQVEDITPPARQPFDQVRERVREDVVQEAVRHTQEVAAAGLLAQVNRGQTLADAATIAGVRVVRSAPAGRDAAPPGVPQQLLQPLFSLKKGEATMVETGEGFVVAVLADIQTPDAKSDPIGYGQARQALERSLGDDYETTYVAALRQRAQPWINREMLDNFAQQ